MPVNRPRALEYKRPAEIVRAPQPYEVMSAPYLDKWMLVKESRRLAECGEIVILGPVVWRKERARWEVRIGRLRQPPPRWRKPLLIGTTIAVPCGGLLCLLWWALSSLTITAGAAFLLGVLVTFICCIAGSHRSGGGTAGGVSVSVSTSVNVTVR
jgi:hypothetical protein